MRIIDAIDVIFIALIVYGGFLGLKQRISRSFALTIIAVGSIYLLSHIFNLYLTSLFFQAGLSAILAALVLIFQTDIRRIFEQLSTFRSRKGRRGNVASTSTVDTLTESLARLADNKIGALIVIKGQQPLERHIRGGFSLGGRITFPIVYSIFNTQSPSHDGAVIIEGETIEKFGVYLPLSQNLQEGKKAGTRHAAGLGLSEHCDALIIIVSEERGSISIAEHGKLIPMDSAAAVKKKLESYYNRMFPIEPKKTRLRWLTHNFWYKLGAISIAIGLWFFLSFRAENVQRTFTVPIECRNVPSGYAIDELEVSEAKITLTGFERAFGFNPSTLALSVDLSNAREGIQTIALSERNLINKPSNIILNRIEPKNVAIRAYALIQTDIPVHLVKEGTLPESYSITSVSIDPPSIAALIPRSALDEITYLRTEPFDVSDLRQTTATRLKVHFPPTTHPVTGKPTAVRVIILVAQKKR